MRRLEIAESARAAPRAASIASVSTTSMAKRAGTRTECSGGNHPVEDRIQHAMQAKRPVECDRGRGDERQSGGTVNGGHAPATASTMEMLPETAHARREPDGAAAAR